MKSFYTKFLLFMSLFISGVLGWAIVYGEITWPTAPNGEVIGGKFVSILNSLLTSGEWKNPWDGTIKRAAKTAIGGIQFPDGNTQTKAFFWIITMRTLTPADFTLTNGQSITYRAYCNAWEVATGGGCNDSGYKNFYLFRPWTNYYECGWYNTSWADKTYHSPLVYVNCLK